MSRQASTHIMMRGLSACGHTHLWEALEDDASDGAEAVPNPRLARPRHSALPQISILGCIHAEACSRRRHASKT